MFKQAALNAQRMPLRLLILQHALLLATVFIFSGFHVLTKQTLKYMHPVWFVAVRNLLSVPYHFGNSWLLFHASFKISRQDAARVAMQGFLGMFCNPFFYSIALPMSNPTIAAVIFASAPVFLSLFQMARGHERPSLAKFFSVLIAFVGVCVAVEVEHMTLRSHNTLALCLQVLGVSAQTVFIVLQKPLLQSLSFECAVSWSSLSGLVFSMIAAIPFVIAQPTTFFRIDEPIAWIGTLYGGIMLSGVAYTMLSYANERTPTVIVAAYGLMQPPVTALLAFLTLHDSLSPRTAIGGLISIMGLAGLALTKWRESRETEREAAEEVKAHEEYELEEGVNRGKSSPREAETQGVLLQGQAQKNDKTEVPAVRAQWLEERRTLKRKHDEAAEEADWNAVAEEGEGKNTPVFVPSLLVPHATPALCEQQLPASAPATPVVCVTDTLDALSTSSSPSKSGGAQRECRETEHTQTEHTQTERTDFSTQALA